MKRSWTWMRRVLVLALVAVTVIIAAMEVRLRRERRALLSDWAASGETPDEFLARFPSHPDDAAALELERLAAACGIGLVPRESSRWTDREGEHPHSALFDAHVAWGARPDEALPSDVDDWLDAHGQAIDRIADHLGSDPTPSWRFDIRSTEGIPNFLELECLQRVLILRAVQLQRAGDESRAQRDLAATATLAESLLRVPYIICTIRGMAAVRGQCEALRAMRVVSRDWEERLGSLRLEEAASTSIRLDDALAVRLAMARIPTEAALTGGMVESAHAARADLSRSWSWKRRIEALAEDPYDALSVSKLARAQFCLHAAWRGDACSVDPVSMTHEHEAGAKQSLACSMVDSDHSSAWIRMRRLEIDVALTREILRLRRERSVGAAPLLACGDWSFEEELRDDGGFRVAFRGTLPWTTSQPMEERWRPLPLEHVEPPPAR